MLISSKERISQSTFRCTNDNEMYYILGFDGLSDCDGETVEGLTCKILPCSGNPIFACKSRKYLLSEWVCNKKIDCPDGEDENIDICRKRSCSTNQFRCDSGKCIFPDWVCNKIKDCPDGEDESIDLCKNQICSKDQFRCMYGK
ncbi:very low-density lipoprotein receptor-like isoform X2 [Sipha flava]|uniref:Very low-density lipoprotein receptor-like isoform X2 n=1 Tax=Sipha flava TaxID=143950 RepID=A0A8B8FZC6_9HEMI|nr:very low-density lipoprotein receptor-like isoform X2 [Sipha flava]